MNEPGRRFADADQQIGELIALLASIDDPRRLHAACPGRERLGDGTIAAVCSHVADVYARIAEFIATGHSRAPAPHGHSPTLAVDEIITRLTAAREALTVMQDLDDVAATAIPDAGAIRFADGTRTLEEVLTGLLRHQRHQVDAIRAGLS